MAYDAYYARHGHDTHDFDLPSTHRLPTVTASQVLDDLDGSQVAAYSTGLAPLDEALGAGQGSGGVQKGQVTEIWGPPGSGKTSLGIQLAAQVLSQGKGVVWVDCFYPLPSERLRSVVQALDMKTENDRLSAATGDIVSSGAMDHLTHYMCPSLAHFIALLCRPTVACVPPNTALVVVDSLSSLINYAFPKTTGEWSRDKAKDNRKTPGKAAPAPSLSARRLQILQYVMSALQKLAATRNLPVVLLAQCATRMQAAERGATLVPAISASVWDQGVSARVVLFRDWAWDDVRAPRGLHFAGVQKRNGAVASGPHGIEGVSAFGIGAQGVTSVPLLAPSSDKSPLVLAAGTIPAPKRKLADTGFEEVADSEDDAGDNEYGWEGDEAGAADLPPMPSQWQGSEDLIVGQRRDSISDRETGGGGDGDDGDLGQPEGDDLGEESNPPEEDSGGGNGDGPTLGAAGCGGTT